MPSSWCTASGKGHNSLVDKDDLKLLFGKAQLFLRFGSSVEDFKQAREFYFKLIEKAEDLVPGASEEIFFDLLLAAQLDLGVMYRMGIGGPVDKDKARQAIKQRGYSRSGGNEMQRGIIAYEAGNYRGALIYFFNCQELGVDSHSRPGNYEDISKNDVAGEMRQLCRYYQGLIYMHGGGEGKDEVKPDREKASQFFFEAEKEGWRRRGVDPGFLTWKKPAEPWNMGKLLRPLFNLGICDLPLIWDDVCFEAIKSYEFGLGGPKDLIKAIRLSLRALQLGKESLDRVAELYFQDGNYSKLLNMLPGLF